MSISATLSSALSGMTAASRAAEVISSNIANVGTEGFARRELVTQSRAIGSKSHGVEVVGVERQVDRALLSARRLSDSAVADGQVKTGFYQRLEIRLGDADDPSSLANQVANFGSALNLAAARPDSEARLSTVLSAAHSIAAHLRGAASDIRDARSQADARIEADVATLNATLKQVVELNARIRTSTSSNQDSSALQDLRQQAIDRISTLVPIREMAQPNGQVALYTIGGAVLLDGIRAEVTFQPVGTVTEGMQLGSPLSGLSLNGQPLNVQGDQSAFIGGRIAAHFATRDEDAVAAQRQLDAVARDLITRFEDSGLDPTILAGGTGLFTDGGVAFVAGQELGLSNRLMVNAAVDPAQGGRLWRLRDGVGATAPGLAGNGNLLTALAARLDAAQTTASGDFLPGSRSFSQLTGDLVSQITTKRLGAQSETGFAVARRDALKEQELQNGVDTDAELQKLMLVEKAFGANARVMQVVDEMMQTLLGIG